MEKNDNVQTKEEEKLFSGVLRFNAWALGLVLGILWGLAIFIGTNWLVIKGGNQVGPHLGLLSQYFIGYRVSFPGSFIGFFYGFAVGTLSGTFMGWLYNRIVDLKN